MGNSIKDIRRKIKSIRSTRQITKAMELVATSKMKKAVDNAVNLRSYGYSAMNILAKLSKKQKDSHPYLQDRDVKNVLVLLFSTDKGLCGGLNTNLFRKTTHLIAEIEKDHAQVVIHFVTSGRKGADFLRRMGKTVDMAFPAYSVHPKFSDIFPLSRTALKGFDKGNYDQVYVIYPDFESMLLQKPVARRLLPFSPVVFEQMLSELGSKFTQIAAPVEKDIDYKLEPSPYYIAQNIIPQLIEVQLYQAVLETAASEHSARMVAMQNATKAADDLLSDFVLTYNQARQSAITAEIAEIASSSAAIG